MSDDIRQSVMVYKAGSNVSQHLELLSAIGMPATDGTAVLVCGFEDVYRFDGISPGAGPAVDLLLEFARVVELDPYGECVHAVAPGPAAGTGMPGLAVEGYQLSNLAITAHNQMG